MNHVVITSEADIRKLIWSLKRINWLWNILCWWYDKTRVRVASYELRVESLKARFESLKVWVEIQECELNFMNYKFNSMSYKFKSTSYENKSTSCKFKSISYEFKSISYGFKSTSSNSRVMSSNPRIIKSMKTQVIIFKSFSFSKIISPKLFDNSWGKSHVQFLVIISCFTFLLLHGYCFSRELSE